MVLKEHSILPILLAAGSRPGDRVSLSVALRGRGI